MHRLSVIICTHNPNPERLNRVLAALSGQIASLEAELVIVDNASSHPVYRLFPDFETAIRVTESRLGLIHARAAGIRAASGDTLVFVDDDNILAPDYLNRAKNIAENRPHLGVWAGRSVGEYERTPGWPVKHHLARLAVRDLGDERIEGPGTSSAIWAPFGAGMAVRSPVAQRFLEVYNSTGGDIPLGRSGRNLISGEDTFLCRIAARCGYSVSYEPSLRLTHIIPPNRVTLRYLLKLVEAQARSQAILDEVDQTPAVQPDQLNLAIKAFRFLHRCRNPGLHEALTHWAWDRGYASARKSLDKGSIQKLRQCLEQIACSE